MPILSMKCETCNKDFLYSQTPSKKRRFCSPLCIRYTGSSESLGKARGKGFWQVSTEVEKWNKIKSEYERLVIRKEDCWYWKNVPTSAGYGFIYAGRGKIFLAHRISWIIHNGPISNDQWVLHKCDNPICSNPDHLFLGNQKVNMEDRSIKNRHNAAKGINHYNVKLNEEQVIKIKELIKLGYSQHQLAKMFNISASNIQNISDGKIWKHLGE